MTDEQPDNPVVEVQLDSGDGEDGVQTVALILSHASVVEWGDELVPCCRLDRAAVAALAETLAGFLDEME
jgi:hypothetical protein